MRIFLGILAVLAPVAGVVLALPLASQPFGSGDPRGFFGPYLLTALPVWLALLAAPGYFAALFGDQRKLSRSSLGRWWVGISLAVAALCSVVGIIASFLMFLFLVPSLVSLISAVVLLYRAFRGRTPSQA